MSNLTWDQRGQQFFPEEYKAFKEGKTIQYSSPGNRDWRDCTGIVGQPAWLQKLQYRVKPGEL